MPIQRTASLPVPSDAIAKARRELAPCYGAQVWDGPDRRVLLVRVPRREPDPVNDVEEAAEFLNQADVKDITHCLLVGDEAVAQVYARPLQDLMLERASFDRRTAASWRARLPGHLAHVVFQAPDDPRRRWRLAVRLPLDTVRDLHEELLEDLADGMGVELESQRMGQVVAVYLVANQDDVRLEADMFLQELRTKWQSEDARRRKALAEAQREAEEQRRREAERRQVLQEMEARLKRSPRRPALPAREGLAEAAQDPLAEVAQDPLVEVAQARDDLDKRVGRVQAGGPLAEATTTIRARESGATQPRAAGDPPASTPGSSTADMAGAPYAGTGGPRTATAGSADAGPAGPHTAAAGTAGISAPRGADTSAAGGADATVDRETRRRKRIPHRVQELRARVDEVVDGRRGAPRTAQAEDSDPWLSAPTATHDGAQTAAQDGAPVNAPAGGTLVRATDADASSDVGAPADTGTAAQDVEVLPVLRGLKERLECAGFETIVPPPTAGHVIDLAAERPEGNVQRIVVRAVERLDEVVAKELLKTARELEVDLVLCVAEATEQEALRLLVATKVEVTRPDDLDAVEV